jgi:hypothetical protein
MVTCAEWQQYRSTGNKAAVLQLEAWIDGFLSGYNTASEETDFIAPKPERASPIMIGSITTAVKNRSIE